VLCGHDGKRLKLSTGKNILPLFWNEKEQRAKQTAKLPQFPVFNARLNLYSSTIQAAYDKLIMNGILPTNERNNSPNTIGKRIKNLKTIMRIARNEGFHNNVEIERKKF